MDFNLDKIAAEHFAGQGEDVVTIDMADYRKFTAARQIIRSSHIVVEKGDLQSVIPHVRKSYAGCISSSEFFVSIRLKEGIPCNYGEVIDLLHAIQANISSDGLSVQWGLAVNARMEEDVRVFILAGVRHEDNEPNDKQPSKDLGQRT